MATLVLTTVGTIIGGPIGGAIGAIIGQQADQALFAPKPRHGSRLGDLAVQTSSYGSAIPKIFGTMRVAGTVIWSTDLREERSASGGGKGQPKTVNYSYSASFAVALSGRPIREVRRIWADGKLLRGAAGDFKSRTGFRLYEGTEDQPVDPLIAAAEGAGQAPAFRGIAYAVFEDLALEDFGNRIPSLSFEVVAEANAVTLGEVAEELSGGTLRGGPTPAVSGYAASGDSVRGAIEALADVVPLSVVEDGAGATLRAGSSQPVPLQIELHVGRDTATRRGAGKLPSDSTIAYYDAARDYQLGLQRAFRPGGGQRSDRRELPAVLSAEAAKALAEHRLASLWAGAARAKLELPWRVSGIVAGTYVRVPPGAGVWRVERWVLGAGRVTLELVRAPESVGPVVTAASPGRPTRQPDLIHGPTTVRLYDLPIAEGANGEPLLVAMAAGTEPGWRRAELMASFDDGASWQAVGSTAAPAVMGTALHALLPGNSALFDDAAVLEVELINDAMWLEARSDAALVAGANLAVVGGELIQFGRAEALGARRFRLSRLLRGRRGTEWAMTTHVAGEEFSLIENSALGHVAVPAGAVGGQVRVSATGIGDGNASPETRLRIEGSALRPPSPVHLRAEADGEGGLHIRWVRRSRLGWAWTSGSDTPLGEEKETYRLELSGAGFSRSVTLGEPVYTYTAAQRAADGLTGAISLAVVQVGSFASSRASELRVH